MKPTENPLTLKNYVRPTLELPQEYQGEKKIVMHSCCAPCAGELMLAIKASGIEQLIVFYNPNIHPVAEYEIRKEENKRYAEELGIPCVDLDYDVDNWFARVKGLEDAPERGERCTVCFDMRFERTALYAQEHGYHVFTSSLGISRWKDMQQINRSGVTAAKRWDNMHYWQYNWRKAGGSARMIEIAKENNFYQQEYCGCVYSLRDTNRWRAKNNRPRVQRGVKFYGKEDIIKSA